MFSLSIRPLARLRPLSLVAAGALCALLGAGSGCSLGARTSLTVRNDTATALNLSGSVTLNRVSGSTVSAYEMLGNGQKGRLLASTTTNDSGEFRLTLETNSAALFLEAAGGRFVDEASGATVTLSGADTLLAPFAVESDGATKSVGISAASDLSAAKLAHALRSAPATQSHELVAAIATSHEATSQAVGFDAAADVAHPTQKNPTASPDETRAALFHAGLSKLATDRGQNSYQLVKDLRAEVATTGQLPPALNAVPEKAKEWAASSRNTAKLDASDVPRVEATAPQEPLARPFVRFRPKTDTTTFVATRPELIRHAYGLDRITFQNGAVAGDGRGQTIAIVTAYDQPNIASDLAAFDAAFGIPDPPKFAKVDQRGGTSYPAPNSGWGLETSLDVEWAHAMAPGASLLLVEADSSLLKDMVAAVDFARRQPGVVVVSMSYGANEYPTQTGDDAIYTTPAGHTGVTFVAASGDTGAIPSYPATSPGVLGVGGTNLTIDGSGNYGGETGWSGSGGGVSAYEPRPIYQAGVLPSAGSRRLSPDVSYDAWQTVFPIYDTAGYAGWVDVGGTSAGTPQWAALVAIANQGRALAGLAPLDGPTQTLPRLYAVSATADYFDVTSGSNGAFTATVGYDLVTGLGSPRADLVAALLAESSAAPTPTALRSPTSTASATPVAPTAAPTMPSPTSTPSATPKPEASASPAPTSTSVPVASPTPTSTSTPVASATPTNTSVPVPSPTPTASPLVPAAVQIGFSSVPIADQSKSAIGGSTILADDSLVIFGNVVSGVMPGTQLGSNGTTDAFIASLSPSGDLKWLYQIGNASKRSDAKAVLSAGTDVMLYASVQGPVGDAPSNPGFEDSLVACFAPDGTKKWIKQFGGGGSTFTDPYRIQKSEQGEIFLSGNAMGSLGGRIVGGIGWDTAFFMKLGSGGATAWVTQFGVPGSDTTQSNLALAFDDTGNPIVAFHPKGPVPGATAYGTASTANSAMAVARLSRDDGSVLNFIEISGAGYITVQKISQSPSGFVDVLAYANFNVASVVGGTLIGSPGSRDLVWLRLDPKTLAFRAAVQFGTGASPYGLLPVDIAENVTGDVFVLGQGSGAAATVLDGAVGTWDTFLFKFNSAGVYQWTYEYGGGNGAYSYPANLVLDPASGDPIFALDTNSRYYPGLTVTSQGTFGRVESVVIRLSATTGARKWLNWYGGGTVNGSLTDAYPYSLQLGSDGTLNLFGETGGNLAGTVWGTQSSHNVFRVRLDTTGKNLAVGQLGVQSYQAVSLSSLPVPRDTLGNFFVTIWAQAFPGTSSKLYGSAPAGTNAYGAAVIRFPSPPPSP